MKNNNDKLSPQQLQQMLAVLSQAKNNNLPSEKDEKPKLPLRKKLTHAFIVSINGAVGFLDRFIQLVNKKNVVDSNLNAMQNARSPILFGTTVLFIFVILGGIWAITAPLNSAAVAVGVVIPISRKQVIQHLEGGVVKAIYVEAGQKVKSGDVLIKLDDTKYKADYDNYFHQYASSLANVSRLISEMDGSEKISFDKFLLENKDNPEIQALILSQTQLFNARKDLINNKVIAVNHKIEQTRNAISGIMSRKSALERQHAIFSERLSASQKLSKQGFVNQKEIADIESRVTQLEGEIGMSKSEVARYEQEIAKDEIDIINTKNDFLNNVLNSLKESQMQLAEIQDRFLRIKDSLERSEIRSPVDGTINDLNFTTIGGVIGQAQQIAEITPANDKLIIEAKVPSKFIDSIKVGMDTNIRFSAFKSRTSPIFKGKVVSISPDTVMDRNAAAQFNSMQAGDGAFYVTKIEIDMDYFNNIAKTLNVGLYPGMQAEVQIVTGKRTLIKYLLDPVTDNMFRAFIEK